MLMSKKLANLPLNIAAVVAVGIGILMPGTAQAAGKFVVYRSQIDFRTLTIKSVENLAKTGEPEGLMSAILEDIGESPETAQQILTETVDYPVGAADRLFNSEAGKDILTQLSEGFLPISEGEEGEQALRSAIIMSLADDGSLSVLAILQNYPVDAAIDLDTVLTYSDNFTGLDKLVEFFSSSEAVSVRRELETLYVRQERRVTETRREITTTTTAPAVTAPVRALW
jgi:hypothetical protein